MKVCFFCEEETSSEEGGIYLDICPRCGLLANLVTSYTVINKKSMIARKIEVERAVCEYCIEELMEEVEGQLEKEGSRG